MSDSPQWRPLPGDTPKLEYEPITGSFLTVSSCGCASAGECAVLCLRHQFEQDEREAELREAETWYAAELERLRERAPA